MLDQIRQFSQIKIVRWVFVLFLVGIFGLFGIETYLQRPATGETVASVGRTSISTVEFENALRDQSEQYRQQFRGAFDPSLMDNPEIRRSVLDRLVNDKLMGVGGERAGLRITDKALAERIASEPFFQADGKFSRDRYDLIAKSQNLTPVGLDERLRRDYVSQDFRGAVLDSAFVPKSTLDSFIRLSEQQREVSVVNLAPEAYVAQVKITPEQVKAYYDSHVADYTTPERARVQYLELSQDALAAKAEVAADDVKKIYDDGMKNNQWGQPEERRASHILVEGKPGDDDAKKKAAEAKANAIAAQVRKDPKSFADVAKKESADPGSAVQGGDLGFFGRGAMVKPFEEAVFNGKKGDLLGPVKSDFGWHVIQLTDVKPAKVKSLADATPEIEAQLKKQGGQRRFAEMAEVFSNTVYEQPASLQPAADAVKLQVKETPWFTRGQPPVPLLANQKLQSEIFSDDAVKAKRNTSAIEAQPGVLVSARVLEYKPSEARPLDSVRAEVERRIQREEALKLARADGEAKLKLLQEGKEAGLKWPAPLAVNRQKAGGLAPQVIDKAFRVDTKKLPGYAGAETPGGYSLVQVGKVIEAGKIEDAQRQALGGQLKQAVSIAELEATLGTIRDRVGVSVRRDAVEKKAAPQ